MTEDFDNAVYTKTSLKHMFWHFSSLDKSFVDLHNCKVIGVGGPRPPRVWNLCCGIKTALNHFTFSRGNFLARRYSGAHLIISRQKDTFVGSLLDQRAAHLIIHFGISTTMAVEGSPSQGYFSDWSGRQLTRDPWATLLYINQWSWAINGSWATTGQWSTICPPLTLFFGRRDRVVLKLN